MASEAEILAARRKRAQQLRDGGETLFPARVPERPTPIPEVLARFGSRSAEQLADEPTELCVAGRIVALRSFGKAAFVSLRGEGERFQLWVQRDEVGADRYRRFKLFDLGDLVWARGGLLRTRTGELTLEVREIRLLAKSYRPLPEKWHGLVDLETRYRQRYLDLLVNRGAREIALHCSRLLGALRELLAERGFLEVETPILQPIYGGANARPFTTHHHTYGRDLYLRISFELYLKRLIVGGLDRVYELGRDFRNEGISRKHSPEFTMLEAYQAWADYRDMMELVEVLVVGSAERVLGRARVEREGVPIDLAPPWPRRSMRALLIEACGIDIERERSLETLQTAVRQRSLEGLDPEAATSWAGLVDELFSLLVEPKLVQPTFVVDYPVALSPLAKRCEDRPDFVERFELFIAGMEIANAFSELNDPDDQRERFREQAAAAQRGDHEAHPIDEDYLRALEHGMPPTGGMGLGVGRLAMVLTGATHLREVTLFPHLRPRDADG
ncbi:MAG: lysine--tRNA ligase [Myxococcota bacterium]